MRNRTTIFSTIVVLSMIAALAYLIPARLIDPANLVPGQNAAPQVIPSLREWQGGSGSFTLSSDSPIDAAYATQLESTAQVFQSDVFDVTRLTLPVIEMSSPQAGDFFLTLHNFDRSIGSEGYLFTVGNAVVINAHTSTGVFYGTRTALQILLSDPAREHIAKGTARDYPQI